MHKIGKAVLYICLFVGAAGFTLYGAAARAQSDCPPVLRLHVVANSDSEYDQQLKAEVRDRVIGLLRDSLSEAEDMSQAEAAVSAGLTEINAAAESVLEGRAAYGSRAELGVCSFPTKGYGGLVLPAGEYKALRIVLGEGEGHNWWCVLFPSLCYVDAVGEVDDAMAVSTGREGVRLRWKIIELLRALK